MATKKFANKAEAKEALSSAKEEKKAAFSELRAFEKENELAKGGDHSKDAKVGKKWNKLNETYQKKKASVEELEGAVKETKSDKTARKTVYDYPADIKTAGEKKKYRAKMRAEKKRAAKGDKTAENGTEKKASKKDKKKGKKKEVAAETED